MNGVYNFIVETSGRYLNKVDVEGNELIVNTEITERDHHFVNRIGKIEATPLSFKSPIKKGDQVLLHHNVFRKWYDMRGKLKESSNWFKDDQFFVYPDQIFAYKRKGKWNSLDKFIFVKPIENTNIWDTATYREDIGEVIFSNKLLEKYGIKRGTIVRFRTGEFVEVSVEGQKLYRILSNHVYGYQEEKGAGSTSSGERDRRADQGNEQKDGCCGNRSGEGEDICLCVSTGDGRCHCNDG